MSFLFRSIKVVLLAVFVTLNCSCSSQKQLIIRVNSNLEKCIERTEELIKENKPIPFSSKEIDALIELCEQQDKYSLKVTLSKLKYLNRRLNKAIDNKQDKLDNPLNRLRELKNKINTYLY